MSMHEIILYGKLSTWTVATLVSIFIYLFFYFTYYFIIMLLSMHEIREK